MPRLPASTKVRPDSGRVAPARGSRGWRAHVPTCQGRGVVRIGRLLSDGLLIVVVTPCFGCGMVSRNFPTMQNPAPVVRARTIARNDSRLSTRELPVLLGRLEDADPVVRLAAHEELRRKTGRDFGFVPWGSPEERSLAVGRWRSWLSGSSRGAGPVRSASVVSRSSAGKVESDRTTIPRGTITEDP